MIFVSIFSERFDVEKYPLYALTGLIFWNYFNTTVNQILYSIVASAEVLKSMNVPRLIFPISALLSALINLILSLVPFFILMFFFEFEPSVKSFQFIYILICFSSFTLGFGLIVCALNVYFRDVGMLWTTINPALFYFSPIIWKLDMLPEFSMIRRLTILNPIHHFLHAFRTAFYENEWMSLEQTGTITLIGIAMLFIGYRIFSNLEKGFYSHY